MLVGDIGSQPVLVSHRSLNFSSISTGWATQFFSMPCSPLPETNLISKIPKTPYNDQCSTQLLPSTNGYKWIAANPKIQGERPPTLARIKQVNIKWHEKFQPFLENLTSYVIRQVVSR